MTNRILPSARSKARHGALLAALALLTSACAKDAPQDFLNNQAGEHARTADQLWDVTFIVAVVIFVIVEGLLVYALVRFRARPGREAAQFHGNTRLEVILTLVPALILAAIGVPTVKTIFDFARVPNNALNVTVVARQFWWEYRYDLDDDGETDVTTANELHIPVNTNVRLQIEGDAAGNDVIHSFWIPRLAGTQDAVPGRVNYLNLRATETGRFMGQCKEFCGLSHANMRIIAYVQDKDDFNTWVAQQQEPALEPSDSLAQEGARLFVEGSEGGSFANGPACATCHTINGLEGASGLVAPDLTHLASRSTFAGALFDLNEGNLHDWLNDPPGVKPGSRMPKLGLTEDEIEALVAYLMELK